jgi:hypothetical protein
VLLIGGANDKLRGSAEGLPGGAVQGKRKGIVKLETKRNETGRDFWRRGRGGIKARTFRVGRPHSFIKNNDMANQGTIA